MDKSIFVSLSEFRVEAREDGKPVRIITTCSFGREGHRTPIIANGDISPTKRDRMHHSTIYNSAPMPLALFFEQDPTCAFHQGNPQVPSHGCVHLNQADAEWLFDWASKDPVKLQMVGPYPLPPVKAGAPVATS